MSLAAYGESLAQSLAKANLVPGSAADVIPDHFKPSIKLEVSYNDRAVELGNFFRAGECQTAPTIQFHPEVSVITKIQGLFSCSKTVHGNAGLSENLLLSTYLSNTAVRIVQRGVHPHARRPRRAHTRRSQVCILATLDRDRSAAVERRQRSGRRDQAAHHQVFGTWAQR